MTNPTATIDRLQLATNSATALIDIVCGLHSAQLELPRHFDALGALVCGCLEDAAAEAGDKLRVTLLPDREPVELKAN
jgi:hypothetical protein